MSDLDPYYYFLRTFISSVLSSAAENFTLNSKMQLPYKSYIDFVTMV